MCSKKEKSTTQSKQTNTLTPWSQQQWTQQTAGVLGAIDDYNKSSPHQVYTGKMVADLSDTEQRARQYAFDNMGAGDGLLGEAADVTRGALAYDGSDVSKWYNPYEQDVIDATSALYDEDLQGKISDNQARATLNGSYGGSRHGVMDAELNRGAALDKAKMIADLKREGYVNAQQQGRANQQAQFQGAGLLGTMSGEKQRQVQNEIALLSQLGADEREIAQAKLLAERAEFDREAEDAYRRFQIELQTRIGLLGSTPMLTNSEGYGSSTSKVSDPMGGMANILGGAGGLLSGLGAMKFGPSS